MIHLTFAFIRLTLIFLDYCLTSSGNLQVIGDGFFGSDLKLMCLLFFIFSKDHIDNEAEEGKTTCNLQKEEKVGECIGSR